MTEESLRKRYERDTALALLSTEDEEPLSSALSYVSANDFSSAKWRVIYEAVSSAVRDGEKYSYRTAALQLEKRGHLGTIGGYSGLLSYVSAGKELLLDAPASTYARAFKELSSKHRIKEFLDDHLKSFEEDSGVTSLQAASEVQNYLNERIFNLSEDGTFILDASESYDSYLETLKKRTEKAKEGTLVGIPTLLPTLDEYTTGWQPGQIIVVGARTGIGKSVFGINCATSASSAGKSVLFVSLEMSVEEIEDRIYASVTGIPMDRLKSGEELTSRDYDLLKEAGEEVSGWKLRIDTTPHMTIDTLRSKALEHARTNGLDLIVVDYLQLMESTEKGDSRQVEVQKLSRSMKLLAKNLDVPIIVLVQVNRESKDDENAAPQLSQIRESGAIAQDANVVVLLHRDATDDGTIPPTIIHLAKNRNGPANKYVVCHSNLATSTFIEKRSKPQEERATVEDEQESYDSIPEFDDPWEDADEPSFVGSDAFDNYDGGPF